MFSLLGVKKREPLFTFKRKTLGNFSEDPTKKPAKQVYEQSYADFIIPSLEEANAKNDLKIHNNSSASAALNIRPSSSTSSTSSTFTLSSPVNSSSSSEIPVIREKEANKKESKSKTANAAIKVTLEAVEDDSIFDFPNTTENFSEIKVMVASTRAIPEVPKLKRKKSNTLKKGSKSSKPSKNPAKQHTAPVKQTNLRQKKPTSKLDSKRNELTSSTSSLSPYSSTPQTIHNSMSSQTMPSQTMPSQTMPSQTMPYLVQTQNSFDIFDFDPEPRSLPPQHLYSNRASVASYSNSYQINSAYYYTDLSSNPTIHNYTLPITQNQSHSLNTYNDFSNLYGSNFINAPNSNTMLFNPANTNTNTVSIAGLLNSEFQLPKATNLVNVNNNFNQNVNNTNTIITQPQLPTSFHANPNPPRTCQSIKHLPQSSEPKRAPVEKKRKRNLVAHLRTATGEKDNKQKSKKFDFLSDEEEMAIERQQESELLPLKEIITNKERSLSPEISYAERMELELEAVMRSEFGGKTKPVEATEKEITERRHQYQPLNKVNVKVTFQKKKS